MQSMILLTKYNGSVIALPSLQPRLQRINSHEPSVVSVRKQPLSHTDCTMPVTFACHPRRMILLHTQFKKIQSRLMEMPITHDFAPYRHLKRYDVEIYKKPGDYRSEKLRLVHGIAATENQALKICVAWEIKRLVKNLTTSSINFNLVINFKLA
jgi:hypothetical protein